MGDQIASKLGSQKPAGDIGFHFNGANYAISFTADQEIGIETLAHGMCQSAKTLHATVFTYYDGVALEARIDTNEESIIRRFHAQRELQEKARLGRKLEL